MSDKGSEKSGGSRREEGSARSGGSARSASEHSHHSNHSAASLVEIGSDFRPFKEDPRVAQIIARLGESPRVRFTLVEQEVDLEALHLLDTETLVAMGIPKASAQRIVDEVAKMKESENQPSQIEQRMDNVHLSDRDAEETDEIIHDLFSNEGKYRSDAVKRIRELTKDGLHRRSLTKALLEELRGGRFPALSPIQREALLALVDISGLAAGREYLREQKALATIYAVVPTAAEEKEFESALAAMKILAEMTKKFDECMRDLRETPDIAARLLKVAQVNNPEVQAAALNLLFSLTLGSGLVSGQIDALQSKGIPALYRLASQGADSKVRGAAAKVIGAACAGDYMSGYMQSKISPDMLQNIIAMLNSNDEFLRAGGATALAYVVDNNTDHKKMLSQYGTVAKLVELLSHTASPDVQEAAALALRGVVRNRDRHTWDKVNIVKMRLNKQLFQSIRSSGAVNALANLLKSGKPQLRTAALSALYEISVYADPDLRIQVANACTPATIVAALQDDNQHTQFYALNLVGMLTFQNDVVTQQFLQAEVVPPLKRLQASQDTEVKDLAWVVYDGLRNNQSRMSILNYHGFSIR